MLGYARSALCDAPQHFGNLQGPEEAALRCRGPGGGEVRRPRSTCFLSPRGALHVQVVVASLHHQ